MKWAFYCWQTTRNTKNRFSYQPVKTLQHNIWYCCVHGIRKWLRDYILNQTHILTLYNARPADGRSLTYRTSQYRNGTQIVTQQWHEAVTDMTVRCDSRAESQGNAQISRNIRPDTRQRAVTASLPSSRTGIHVSLTHQEQMSTLTIFLSLVSFRKINRNTLIGTSFQCACVSTNTDRLPRNLVCVTSGA
jgi:hypothetical protein